MTLKRVKGENFYRDAKSAARVKMLNGGKAVRDRDGKIIKAAAFQKGEDETKPGRVQPDRRWFGNTRVISQNALDHFRTSLAEKKDDPYSVLLKRNKLPMALLDDAAKGTKVPPSNSRHRTIRRYIRPQSQRKRPRLDASIASFQDLAIASADGPAEGTAEASELPVLATIPYIEADVEADEATHGIYQEPIYAKGTSRRIYGELYKVLDSSDVVIHVLDARDPLGTMCKSVTDYLRKEKSHKQVVLLLNKCDLVPTWVTVGTFLHLNVPRLNALPGKIRIPFVQNIPYTRLPRKPHTLFWQRLSHSTPSPILNLHSDKKQISVGFIGYPNVGKSSVINCLKKGRVCRVAPIPGNQVRPISSVRLNNAHIAPGLAIYHTHAPDLPHRLSRYCPSLCQGFANRHSTQGVVRVENLPTPSEHIPALLDRVRTVYLERTYDVHLRDTATEEEKVEGKKHEPKWDADEFLDALARKSGKLLKGGEPDRETIAKMVLNDWIRGKIPFFVRPPDADAPREEGKEEKSKLKVGGILVRNAFEGEDADVKRAGGDHAQEEDEEDADGEGSVDAEGEEEEDEEETPAHAAESESESESEASELEKAPAPQKNKGKGKAPAPVHEENDSDNPVRKKDPRMTTNKKKATNFFTTANVKNRNRDRKTPKAPGSKAAVSLQLKAARGGKENTCVSALMCVDPDLQTPILTVDQSHTAHTKMSFVTNTFRYLRHQAHENPTIVWSIAIGAAGPLAVVVVPPVRRRFGWVPDERIPTSYPLPNRARSTVTGYDDPQ
ncbi:Nuclear/nucleolar GTPase 2 [Rhizoctonia solani]|uniref:Nucleolar GTP-binding protein 2 n=1 Tax=Rhizoctonia solani TaxID=456999 RepID=A0A8H7M317_9AGAM|nr:Nuclear/nucleolar GTPase 2 [Rhizoctonia solani]